MLGGKYLERCAPTGVMPMLRTQLFIVLGLVDAVPMIGVGIGLYVVFGVAGNQWNQSGLVGSWWCRRSTILIGNSRRNLKVGHEY